MRILAVILIGWLSTTVWAKDKLGLSATALLGVPHPINLGFDARISETCGGGATGGKFSYTLKTNNTPVNLGSTNIEGRIRYFLWKKSFFIGSSLGWQSLTAEATKDISVTVGPTTTAVPTTVKVTVNSLFVTPHIGWFIVYDSGFTLGFEVGAQFPISPASSLDVSTSSQYALLLDLAKQTDTYRTLDSDINDAAKKVGKLILPFVTILRIGWTF